MSYSFLASLISFLFFSISSWAFVTSHKTAGLEHPENSMAGFQHSLNLNVDAIELDLHLTKDHHLILSHDPVLDHLNCFEKKSKKQIVISQTNLKELQNLVCQNHKIKENVETTYRLPSFKEILTTYLNSDRTDIELNVEIKVWDELIGNTSRYKGLETRSFHFDEHLVAQKVYQEVREVGLQNQIMFTTFSKSLLLLLKESKRAEESFRFGLLFKGDYAPMKMGWYAWLNDLECADICWWPFWEEAYQWMEEHQMDAFIPNWEQLSNIAFRRGYRKWFQKKPRNFVIFPWTLNSKKDWDYAESFDFDGMITDVPSQFLER